MKGVWLVNLPHSPVFSSKDRINRALDSLVGVGCNAIFPVVWNRGYTLFPSQVMVGYGLPAIAAPYQAQQRDPLQELVEAATARNMQIFPWFEYGFAASHLPNGGHILAKYPDWCGQDHEGKPLKHGGLIWLNAFNPQVQNFLVKLVLEVVNNYAVTGIQGCDRFPASPVTGGYDSLTQKKFQAQFQKSPPANYQAKHWVKWRSNLLTEFLRHLRTEIKKFEPKLLLSLAPAVYPFCLHHLLQDPLSWIQQGLIDWLHPQVYRSSFFAYQREVNKIKRYFPPHSWSKIAPGIAVRASGKNLAPAEFYKCCQLNRHSGLAGSVIFYYDLIWEQKLGQYWS